jgi:hypothetical protein
MADVQEIKVLPTGSVDVALKASFEIWEDDPRWAELLRRVHQELNEEMRKKGVSASRVQRRVSFWKWEGLNGEREVGHAEGPDSVRVEMRAQTFRMVVEDVAPYAARPRGGGQ